MKVKWTDEESNYLIEHYGTHSYYAIGKALGRTISSVKNRAKVLGIQKDISYNDNRNRSKLTEYQRRIVRDYMNTLSPLEIAKKLKLSVFQIEDELKRIGRFPNKEEMMNEKESDYRKFMLDVMKVKNTLINKGALGGYTLVSALKDKAVLLDKKGHRTCFTYTELTIKLRGEEVDEEDAED